MENISTGWIPPDPRCRPVLKFYERRKTPSFCLISFILGLAFADQAFASTRIREPIDIWNIKIPERLLSVPIEWRPEWEPVPLLRRTFRTSSEGARTSPTLAAQFSQMAKWNIRLGKSFGMQEDFQYRMLRRGAGNAINGELCQSSAGACHADL